MVAQYLLPIWAWIKANPVAVVMAIAIIVNFLYAQLPKPTSVWGLKLWTWLRAVLLVCTTHASEPGTFTWPKVLQIIIDALTKDPEPPAELPPSKQTPLPPYGP